ncbi:hypothetical protein ACQPU1_08870 [Clostridium paraputrificum]|uniref:hypothetical protein n=1 Tax=Clostridium TaxID=1485 RepID=UPI003D342E34
MKNCPYCNESITYKKLMTYAMGKGFTKYDECPNCNKPYQVKMNIFFIIAIIAITFVIVKVLLKADSRFENITYAFVILLLTTPIFPLFMKVSEAE